MYMYITLVTLIILEPCRSLTKAKSISKIFHKKHNFCKTRLDSMYRTFKKTLWLC